MSLKAPLIGLLIILIGFLSVSTHSVIEAKPNRQAVIKEEGKYTQLRLTPYQIVTDTKAIDFVTDVVSECFSLTAINAVSKSDYCADRYFHSNAATVYKTRFVNSLIPTLEANDASYYSVAERTPIIVSTPANGKPYYVIYAPVLSTTVLRTRRPAERTNLRMWVQPTTSANNPRMYQIIGFHR